MPVSVCDPVRDALLELSNENTSQFVAKRVLMTHIEYEETGTYQTNHLEALRCKYIILNQNKKTQGKESGTNGPVASKDILLPEPNKVLFPQEAIQLGWQNNRQWNVGAGMINVGNTCYLNSTLQALFHVPSLANWLVNEISHSDLCEDNGGGQGGCIICAMSKTLLASQNTSGPIKPWLVYSKLRLVCRHLIPGRQEDAHEFLRYLVEAMEKSYLTRFKGSKDLDQYSKETTPLNRILGGYLRSTVRCLSCGHVSVTFQHFQDLLLDIRKVNTLDEALECYFARERLEDMGYRCESCKCKVSATKQFSLERPPSVLCIQLKRFSMMGNKINKHIAFNSKLDLSKFLCKNSMSLSYKLVAMVTHIGSSQNCGHYTAIGQCNDGNYYQFDDSLVRLLPLHSVLATNAYIMLYESEKTTTPISHTVTPSNSTNSAKSNGEIYRDEKNIKNFIPLLKSDSTSDIKLKKPEKIEIKGFIGPILPLEYLNFNQKYNKILINDKNKNINHIVQKNETKMAGSKLVQQNQSRSMPLLSEEIPDIPKKKVVNLSSSKNPSTINDINNIKIPSQLPIQQIPHLKTNGYRNNISTSNIISLVPYDGSDESNSEIDNLCNRKKQEINIDTKATMPHWKVSSMNDKVLLSPSLRGEAGWSPKKIINKINDNSLITNGPFNSMSRLLHMSQQEYGDSVTIWNRSRSRLEKETPDERREQRKRPVDELDHGHAKKMKQFAPHDRVNPNYNIFQEYRNSHSWNHHGRFSFKNNHRNMSHSRHRGAPCRGRHKSYNQRHNYHRH